LTRIFEQQVMRRALHSLSYGTASCGGFRDVMELQQYASGAQHLASPDQVKRLALRFGIPIPAGYGQAAEKAA
jgi:hypothetical protein